MSAYPTDVVADRAAGTLTVIWDDGHVSEYATSELRWACPCAICSGEAGMPGRLASLSALPADELTLSDLLPVGAYALAPVWASGHSSGIYSFEYLRSLCPCRACLSR